jgi:ABC-type transport system substrate-binding protein
LFCLSTLSTSLFGGQGAISVGNISQNSLNLDITAVDDAETVFILRQVSQPLVDYNANGQIVPSVAKYWTVSKDMKIYDFYLREGMRFSDGSELTAKDVAFSLNEVKSSEFNPLRIYFNKISTIVPVSANHVRITLSLPWSGFMHCIASGLAPIFSSEAFSRDASFLGSGPYRLIGDGRKFYLAKNQYYKGVYPPLVSSFRILTESDTDTPDIAINNFDRFFQDHSYLKAEVDSFSGSYLMVNPLQSRWKDKRKRFALLKMLISTKQNFFGAGRSELKDIFPKGMPGFDINHRAYDQLLQAANLADVSDLKGERIVLGSPKAIPGFTALKKRVLAEYGVDLENRIVDVRHALPEMSKDRTVDIFAFGWNSIFSHPDASLTPFHILGFQNLDEKIPVMIQRVVREEDQIKQNLVYRKLAAFLIENAYVLPLGQKKLSVMTKSTISMSKYRYRYTLQLSEVSERD